MLFCPLVIYNAFGNFGKREVINFCFHRDSCRPRRLDWRDAGRIGSVSALSHGILLFLEEAGLFMAKVCL